MELRSEFSNLIKFVKPRSVCQNDDSTTTVNDTGNFAKASLSGSEAMTFYSDLVVNCSSQEQPKQRKHDKSSAKHSHGQKRKYSEMLGKCEGKLTNSVGKVSCQTEPLSPKLLFQAAQNGDVTRVTQCLNSGLDVNVQDNFGWTALMCACAGGHRGVVKLLLQNKANICIKDSGGNTAVSIAAKNKHKDIVNCIKYSSKHDRDLSVLDGGDKPIAATSDAERFYCEVCKKEVGDLSKKKHNSSMVHLFNMKLKPKKDNFMAHSSNKGYQMMRKTGWDGEGGLGSQGQGQKYPVKTVLKKDRKCLGAETTKQKPKVTHFGPRDVSSIQHIQKVPERKMTAKTLSKRVLKAQERKKKTWEKQLRWEFSFDL